MVGVRVTAGKCVLWIMKGIMALVAKIDTGIGHLLEYNSPLLPVVIVYVV